MCGIAGLLSLGDKPVSEYEVQSMCDAMVHRGPNDAGYYVRDGVALGMRRLSIICGPRGQADRAGPMNCCASYLGRFIQFR